MSTHAAIRPALPAISVIVSSPASGRPISAADVPNPVMYTAGNPASSTSRAASGSDAPGATIICPPPPARPAGQPCRHAPPPFRTRLWTGTWTDSNAISDNGHDPSAPGDDHVF